MEDIQTNYNESDKITIKPRSVYGLGAGIIGNIHFNLQQNVIYPVEGVLAIHDFVKKSQKFIYFQEDAKPLAIAISPNRKLLAVLEDFGKLGCEVCTYDLITLKKRRSLPMPKYDYQGPVIQMLFTEDSKSVALLTKPPFEVLYLLLNDSAHTVYETRPTITFNRGSIQCMACHPTDSNIIAVGGNSLLLFFNRTEKGFDLTHNVKTNYHITSMAFMSADILIIGTKYNELLIVEKDEIKLQITANTIEVLHLNFDGDIQEKNAEFNQQFSIKASLIDSRVLSLTCFPLGFAFAIFNQVFVFEKVSRFKYERKTVLTLKNQYYPESLFQIENLAIDGKQETVIVTAKHAQIYIGVLLVPETLKTKFLDFEPLGILLHINEIVYASVCAWKPIIMTASRDQTVRIFNYETRTTELVGKFQVDINIAELNPFGFMAAIGFNDLLRIAQVFIEEFNIVKTYNFPHCNAVRFSNLGQYMGAAYDDTVAITSVFHLEIVHFLKGHDGTVTSLCWMEKDKYLISSDIKGSIRQWDVKSGACVQNISTKASLKAICCTINEPYTIYAVTSHGSMCEFQNSEFVREITVPSQQKGELVDICLSRSDMIMFVSNEFGKFFNIPLPLMDENNEENVQTFNFFVTQVNKILFTYDGLLLITVSKGGTLAIWNLQNIDGKIAPIDPDLLRGQEVLIPRKLLKEKNEQIADLERRLKNQVEEFQFKVSQNEILDGQQMAEVHRGYCMAMEELKLKNNEKIKSNAEQIEQVQAEMKKIKDDHMANVKSISTQHSDRLHVEYSKFARLRDSMLQLRENYEAKLQVSSKTLQDTVKDLEENYQKQLDERRHTIRDLLNEMSDKKVEFFEFCRQVEVDHDRNLVELQLKYENKLNAVSNETKLWLERTNKLQVKFNSHSRDIENMTKEVNTLKDEHFKSQNNIAKLNLDIKHQQSEIKDRDNAIEAKQQRITDLEIKNIELEKYRKVLTSKIEELKAQIKPREDQITDKSKHILEIDNELSGLKLNNLQLDLKLKELKDKYVSIVADLRIEQHRFKAARECAQNLCHEIYYLAQHISNINEMKRAIKAMFHRHTSDNELKRFISMDPEVRDEFQKQRTIIERVLSIYSTRESLDLAGNKFRKLIREYDILTIELENQKKEHERILERYEVLTKAQFNRRSTFLSMKK